MDKNEYREYLKSDTWKERRIELMELSGWLCSNCGDKASQLHHLNYNHLGEEELDIDVIPLCNECHKEVHNKNTYGAYGSNEETYGEWY